MNDARHIRIEDVLAADLAAITGERPVREYAFVANRKFKFDIAYPKQRIAIEVAGRYHLTFRRFRVDCERNNFAISRGWILLTVPASSMLSPARRQLFCEQVNRILCGVFDDELDIEVISRPLR